jgi:dihydropyrimidinase
MADHDLVIRGGRLVEAWGELDADVAVDGERIAAVGRGLRGRRELDADGLLVLPGAVDGHVHMRTERPVDVYDDTFATGTVAAAFGGVTAIVDQAQVEPGMPLEAGLDARLAEADGQCMVDYGLHLNLREPSLQRVGELPGVIARGCAGVKLFMSYETYMLPDEVLFRAMQATAGAGGLAIVHAENGRIVAELARELGDAGRADPRRFPAISPPVMEGEATHRALALASLAGARLLVFHLTSVDAVRELRLARERGQWARGEALLHHLLVGDEVYADAERAPAFMGTPPLRGPEHRAALWAALADGTLDIVSTDHGPRRRRPDAAGRLRMQPGTSGVEVRLGLMHTHGVLEGRIARSRWVELCCAGPARLHGLTGKGRLAPGYDADIVLFDPAARLTLTASALHSDIDHATYEGEQAIGWPVTTISRGEVIVHDGRLLGAPGRGRFLRRAAPA